jgi:hypothetical protein
MIRCLTYWLASWGFDLSPFSIMYVSRNRESRPWDTNVLNIYSKSLWCPYVFSVRYEHHLHIKELSYPSNRLWRTRVSCEVRISSTYKKLNYPSNRLWMRIGLRDVEDPTLPRPSAHRCWLRCQLYGRPRSTPQKLPYVSYTLLC